MIFFFCLCGFFFLWFLCYYHWDFGSSKHLWLYAKYGNHWKTFSCSCILLHLNYCDGLELCLNSLLPWVLRQYSCGINIQQVSFHWYPVIVKHKLWMQTTSCIWRHHIQKMVRNLVSESKLSFATRACALSSINVIQHVKRKPLFLLMLCVSDGRGGVTIWCTWK